MTYPTAAEVVSGIVFGASDELTGNLTLPPPSSVLAGVQYGANGTQFTGTNAGPFVQPSATKIISEVLCDATGAPLANRTGLKWAFSGQSAPGALNHPEDQGTTATTNSSGLLTLTVHTSLSSGGTGQLQVTTTDGTTSQTPTAIAFCGPVTVH